MPRKSVEARLQSLHDQRDALAAKIKTMQAEQARELRKRQRQREAIVGRIIYQLVADGDVITADTWSEEFLQQTLDNQLKRARDRQLFGLSPLESLTQKKTTSASSSSSALKNTKKSKSTVTKEGKQRAISSGSERKSAALPCPTNQDELMSEFNL